MSAHPNWLTAPHLTNGIISHNHPGHNGILTRPRTPSSMAEMVNGADVASLHTDMEWGGEEDPRKQTFREMYLQSEAAIATLFGCSGAENGGDAKEAPSQAAPDLGIHVDEPSHSAPPKKSARTID